MQFFHISHIIESNHLHTNRNPMNIITKISTIFFILSSIFSQSACQQEHQGDNGTTQQNFAYITNQGANTVSVINTQNQTVIKTLNVGKSPVGVAVSASSHSARISPILKVNL